MILIAAALIISAHGWAKVQEQPTHMVEISTSGLGWSAEGLTGDIESDSLVEDAEISYGNFAINYYHTITSRFQLGGFYQRSTSEVEVKYSDNSESKTENSTMMYGLIGYYNFSDDLRNAFYLGGGIVGGSEDTETSTSEENVKYSGFAVLFGKRFSLEDYGLANLSYSPNITIAQITYQEDYEEAGIEGATYARIIPIKFDLMF